MRALYVIPEYFLFVFHHDVFHFLVCVYLCVGVCLCVRLCIMYEPYPFGAKCVTTVVCPLVTYTVKV